MAIVTNDFSNNPSTHQLLQDGWELEDFIGVKLECRYYAAHYTVIGSYVKEQGSYRVLVCKDQHNGAFYLGGGHGPWNKKTFPVEKVKKSSDYIYEELL